jgi:hypothetical protein
MEIQRRDFLKGFLASGAVAATATAGISDSAKAAMSAEKRKVTLLLSDSSLEKRFSVGVKSSKIEAISFDLHKMSKETLSDPKAISQTIAKLKGRSVMGLMGDSDFILFQEMVRDAGGQMLCVGQHVWGGSAQYDCRHEFVSGPQSQGIGSALSDTLSRGAVPHSITETTVGTTNKATGKIAHLGSEKDWVGSLGQALGQVASGEWQSGPVWSVDRPSHSSEQQARQSIVSFVAVI